MFEGRKLDHIGLQCVNSEETAEWYMKNLGFSIKGKFKSSRGDFYTWFVTNGEITYEIMQKSDLDPMLRGKVEHIAINSGDIEADYEECKKLGLTFATDGIQKLDRWENGCRFFKVLSISGEPIEFNQNL